MQEIIITEGYQPGAIGRIAELHGKYYNKSWHFGLYFEAKVATELSSFLERYESSQDRIWLVILGDSIEGSIIIDGLHADTDGAHLRWFIISDNLQGRGIGRKLLGKAMDFCTACNYRKTFLWTFQGLNAARRLYDDAGFKLVRQQTGDQWGNVVNEQYFERILK